MQVCAPVTFPINTVEHLTSFAIPSLQRTLSTTTQWYYLNLQLELFLIPFSSLLVWISGAVSSCRSPGLFLPSLIFLFYTCITYNSIQSSLESIDTLCNMEMSLLFGRFLPEKVLGHLRVISPYFQHLNLLKEHNRASIMDSWTFMGPTWSTWMLLSEGFD